eukprot:CAMPEP_0197464438 /NCGR_PEP_ID=MMETSP1175-20131217/64022_1 /TAXON_ID=1003142 /ORGANISM="Triceratium dubium, Strain CCMP147" /LENGTH=180 /DNA_ID=CAMNT_0043000419 /DNA_START=405 /DNA_END=947 /DNA_ORIENTATION=+
MDEIVTRAKEVGDPHDADLIEKYFQELAPKWPVKHKEWSINRGWSELRALPRIHDMWWATSFATFGIMDKRTGELIYNLCVGMKSSEERILTYLSSGKPTKVDLEQMVYVACTMPRRGVPYRPGSILLSYRWQGAIGADGVEEFRNKLNRELDIVVNLEGRNDAFLTAARNNNDPDGNNF